MPASGIHHLGVAVADLDEAVDCYRRLFGAELELRETSPSRGSRQRCCGSATAASSCSPRWGRRARSGRFLERRGPGMHHVAFEVDDVGLELRRLAAEGAELIDAQPRRGLLGLDVAFVHPHATGGVLAELVAHG